MATPLIQNLNEPTIFIPSDDARFKAIESISPWPVYSADKFPDHRTGKEKIFVLWGYGKSGNGMPSGANVIVQSHPKELWDKGAHEVQIYLDLFPGSTMYPTRIKTARAYTLYRGRSEKFVALFNGSNPSWHWKKWPDENWAALAKKIIDNHNVQFVFLGNSDEKATGKSIQGAVGDKCWNLAGRFSLAETADILSQCDFAIGNDTGLMHVADAVGCQGVALFGATLWHKNSPVCGNFKLIQSESGHCPHFPCYGNPAMWKCRNAVCIKTIKPDQVYEAVKSGL